MPKPPDASNSQNRSGLDALDTYRLFHDLPFIGMAMTSPSTGRWLKANQTLCNLLGYSSDELVQRTWQELTHPDDLEADVVEFERVMAGEIDGYKLDKRYLRRDGTVLHASIDVQAIRNARHEVEYFLCTVADITARVKAEAAARTSANLLRELSQQVPGVICQFQRDADARWHFPFASEGIRDIFEVSPEEMRESASILFHRIHPDDLARVRDTVETSARDLSAWRCEFRVTLPTRGERWMSGSARPRRLADGGTQWYGFISDVTSQQLDREALRESEERFRIQVEHAPEAIVVYDIEADHFVDVNSNAETLFGLSREVLCRTSLRAVSPPTQPDGRPSVDVAGEQIARAMRGELPVFEWMHCHASGRDVPCEIRLVLLPYAGRSLVRASISDITERKAATETLRMLQVAIDSAPYGVAIADVNGHVTYVNRAVVEFNGDGSGTRMLGRDVAVVWSGQDDADGVMQAVRTEGQWRGEVQAPRADGSVRTLQLNASLITGPHAQPAGMLASFVDITGRRKLEAQLLQAQKLESIGRLAGGIAHDFNNLLTVMKGYLELTLSALDDENPVRSELLEVDRAADSAAALTQQLLAFSRKQIIAPQTLDINGVIERVRAMLQRLLGEDVRLLVALAPGLRPIRFDPGQAEQILVNLAANARDAMPDGGTLTIETANVALDATYRRGHPDLPAGEFVLLAVSDSGVGMTSDVRDHAFEPFYTTKPVGRGTGLGLAMIQGAVTQNGGRVDVYSEPGQGTSFKIYLPVATEPSQEKRAPVAPALPRGAETILLAEDDDTVRRLGVRLLRQQGYRVFDFPTGVLALAWLREVTEHVDLLLTDVVMPEMNGKVLADEVRRLRPGVRVLFASGYTANVIVHHGVLKPGVEFLAKPYSISTLAARVRQVLEAPPPAPE